MSGYDLILDEFKGNNIRGIRSTDVRGRRGGNGTETGQFKQVVDLEKRATEYVHHCGLVRDMPEEKDTPVQKQTAADR